MASSLTYDWRTEYDALCGVVLTLSRKGKVMWNKQNVLKALLVVLALVGTYADAQSSRKAEESVIYLPLPIVEEIYVPIELVTTNGLSGLGEAFRDELQRLLLRSFRPMRMGDERTVMAKCGVQLFQPKKGLPYFRLQCWSHVKGQEPFEWIGDATTVPEVMWLVQVFAQKHAERIRKLRLLHPEQRTFTV